MNTRVTAIYCRTAASPSGGDAAMLKQKEFLLRYAKEHGYENTELYEDKCVSGLTMHGRPAFMAMQDAIESGEVERVIVRNLSRVGRNTYEVYRWLADLKARGVEFIASDYPALDSGTLQKLFEAMNPVVRKGA
jgi:DNA invertase Pin-like site-specific DNA recombinase